MGSEEMRKFVFLILTVMSCYSISVSAMQSGRSEGVHPENVVLAYAPINSFEQLDDHMNALKLDSPMVALSQSARERFIAGLQFGSQGLASYDYEPITSELTAAQAYRLLSLFGAQRTLSLLPGLKIESASDREVMNSSDAEFSRKGGPVHDIIDYPGFACVRRATCTVSPHSICMASC
ncbi:hypothetical protein [Stenotrophomonas sp. SAU14A_NAIMI4_5]|uniref:hypothetical protein n=1 Tax=Stenotrophomonas sp. SAU14A_NAIMI4_5 TaxID=2072413 RepID=UPI00131EEDBD|nr:hypothetical protein [Stenotrophomonas sp. SAU14A_NAIMI4_5]